MDENITFYLKHAQYYDIVLWYNIFLMYIVTDQF